MGILLCLCNSGLGHIVVCQELAKSIVDGNLLKCYFLIWDCHIILCKAYEGCIDSLCSLKSVKFICTESPCDFSCPVRSEVKEYYGIAVLHLCYRSTILHNYSRLHKFICHICRIGILDCLNRALCLLACTFCDCPVCLLYSVPSVIPVHGIVASCHSSNLTDTDFLHLVS